MTRGPRPPAHVHPGRLALIRWVHTALWAVVELNIVYLVVAGVGLRRSGDAPGRGPTGAGSVVAAEVLVFAGNGCRCPLSALAVRAGADSGSVTDLYLPRRLAHNLPALHVPVLLLLAWLYRPGGWRSWPGASWLRDSAVSDIFCTGPPTSTVSPPWGVA